MNNEIHTGHLRKMRVHYTSRDEPVFYSLLLDEQQIPLNPLLGQKISLRYKGQIHCVACGRKTNKSFNQGYCFPCFKSLAACDSCIISPEKCHFAAGTCREPEWAMQHCMQKHYVYLANSSGIKIGITRGDQLPVRWIDQGAVQALPIYQVSNRYHSGLLEVIYKQEISDRTQWQRMLKGPAESLDLAADQHNLSNHFKDQLDELARRLPEDAIVPLEQEDITQILYPVIEYPRKIKSFNLDKDPLVEGTLMGIKGQYLLLDSGVINIRKFTAYEVEFTAYPLNV